MRIRHKKAQVEVRTALINSAKMLSCSLLAFGLSTQTYAQDSIEEVVVTGIKRSIQDSAAVKENATVIVDAISAEELGKFPDNNIAESLQRVTGVAIARGRGGEGQFVTIRGLGEEFNAVTYNGRLLATENAGREFSFDNIASELVSSAQVYKSSSAKLGDGSIGGRVNIQSAKPFDNAGTRGAWSVSATDDSLADDGGVRASGVYSTRLNDKVGLLASFSYQDYSFRVDSSESIDTFTGNVTTAGVIDNTPGVALAANGEGARWSTLALTSTQEDRTRTGGTVALQFQPNDYTDMTVDLLYTKFESPGIGYAQTNYFCDPGCATLSNITVAPNGIITSFDADYTAELLTREQQSDSDTFQLGWNGIFERSADTTITADISHSKSEAQRDNFASGNGSGSFYVVGIKDAVANYDYTGGPVPDFAVTLPGAATLANADESIVGAHFTRETFNLVEDQVTTLRLDIEKAFSDTTNISYGIDYTARTKGNDLFDNRGTWCNLFCGHSLNIFPAGFLQPFPISDFLSDSGANIPNNFQVFTPQALRDAYNAFPGGDAVLVPTANLAGSGEIDENVLGAYIQASLEGSLGNTPWTGNFGVRVANTDMTSSGFNDEITGITDVGAGNQTFTFSAATPTSIDNSYTDVLPSFNMNFQLSDNSLLRVAAAQTLTRPTLTDLSVTQTVTGTNQGVEALASGNAQLDPTKSNNVDVSYEYYGDDTTYAVALFHKDINGFVANSVVDEFVFDRIFEVTKPVNGDDAEVTGLELAYSKIFDSGFGFQGNYTYVDSEATSNGVTTALENVSENTFNASGFYEMGPYTARLSVNSRDEYLRNSQGLNGLPEIVDSYTQLDFSASYDINDNFSVFFEGANLTDEDETVFFDFQPRNLVRYYEERGRRLQLGLRGSF